MDEPGKLDSSDWVYTSFKGYNYFGQRYSVAPNRTVLVSLLAEAVCQVAARLARALQVPERSRWLRTLMQWLAPRRYERELDLEQRIWAESIGFVTWKLQDFFIDILFDWGWMVSEQAALEASLRVMAERHCSRRERQRFIKPLNAAMTFYEDVPIFEEALERLSCAGCPGSPPRVDPEVLRELQRETIHTLEHWAFVYRWERLPAGRMYPRSVVNPAKSSANPRPKPRRWRLF